MAFFSGFGGTANFNSGAIAQVKSWSCQVRMADLDLSVMAEKWEAHGGGMASWDATVVVFLDYATGQKNAVDALVAATPILTSAALVLTIATGKTLTGNAIVTGISIPQDVKNNVEMTATFKGDGVLTLAWA